MLRGSLLFPLLGLNLMSVCVQEPVHAATVALQPSFLQVPGNPQPVVDPADTAGQDAATQDPKDASRAPASNLEEPTVELLQSRIAQAESNTNLADATRTDLVNLYTQAIEQLKQVESWSAKIAEYQAGIAEAPQLTEQSRADVAQLPQQPEAPTVPGGLTLDQLSTKLAEIDTRLRERQERLREIEDKTKFRSDRRVVIPELLSQLSKRSEKVARDLDTALSGSSPPQLAEARSMVVRLTKRATEQEARAYDEELRYYQARSDLLTVRREEARITLRIAEAEAGAWRTAVEVRRRQDSAAQQRAAAEDHRNAHPAVHALAAKNLESAARRSQISQRVAETAKEKTEVKSQADRLSKNLAFLKDNFGSGGTAQDIGPFMRKTRDKVNALSHHVRKEASIRRELARIKFEHAKCQDSYDELSSDIDEAVQEELSAISRGEPITPDQIEAVTQQIRELMIARRGLLDSLLKDLDSYFNALIDLDKAERELLSILSDAQQFIDRHVLWIRSAAPLYQTELPKTFAQPKAVAAALGNSISGDLLEHVLLYLGVAAVVSGLLLVNLRLRRQVVAISALVGKATTDAYALTLLALAYTILRSAAVPLALAFLGWRIQAAATPEHFSAAVAARGSLLAAAALIFALRFARLSCHPKGLAAVHFRWNTKALATFKRHLQTLSAVLVPTLLLVTYTERYTLSTWRDSIGRWCLVVALLSTALVSWRVLRPSGALFTGRPSRGKSWIFRSRRPLLILFMVAPISLAIASAAGYHYSATLLAERALFTIGLWWLLLLIYAMLVRWVFVSQRRLALEHASKQAKAATGTATDAGADHSPPSEAPPAVEEPKLDLIVIGDQTRKLLGAGVTLCAAVGLWFIWADVLPALGFLDDIGWSYQIPASAATEGSTATTPAAPTTGRVTLKHIALSVLSLVITFIMAGNIPGLLEITLLKHMRLDMGGRFAVTTLARYIIVGIGVVSAFGMIGVGWSNVQWLVTAMVVGLGFGLQEIFANFVSGIVLLLERPIRVGDVVTVGDTSGTVTQIQMRATTITDWDRKELVIPNKNFITGSVVNWSLSETTLRLVVPVGIAYGSDTDKAETLMRRAVDESVHVLADPEPKIVFWEFGDSALIYRVQCYIPHVDHLIKTRHDLHKRIDALFREAKIEISFPQRDIHVRSVSGQAMLGSTVDGSQLDPADEASGPASVSAE